MTGEPDRLQVQYWDSCLFLNFLTNLEVPRAAIVRQLIELTQIPEPPLRIAASTLVLAEVRPSEAYAAEHREIISELFEQVPTPVQLYSVTRAIASRAREIGAQFPRLTVPDTIHLATALEAGVDVFFTYDGARDNTRRRAGDLLRYDGLIGVPPLRIQTPSLRFRIAK